MPIVMRLDRVMAHRKVSGAVLAERVGISPVHLSNIKRGHIRSIRFATLEALCQVLRCKPGDIVEYLTPEELAQESTLGVAAERPPASPPAEPGCPGASGRC